MKERGGFANSLALWFNKAGFVWWESVTVGFELCESHDWCSPGWVGSREASIAFCLSCVLVFLT